MNLEELSNNYGGVVCDEWAHNLLRQWEIAIESVRADSSIVWNRPLPPIHCVILNNSEVNAFAGKVNEGYVIGIFNGLRVLLSCFFSTLASDPRSFPAIGDIGLESPIDACFGKSLNSAIKKLLAGDCREPADDFRSAYARHLCELSLRFAFEHELAHILLGHIDLATSEKPFVEIRSPEFVDERRNHAIEMHADEVAFHNSFDWILDSLTGRELKNSMQFYTHTIEGQMLDFFCATYCLFELLSAEQFSSTHPSPIHRQVRLGLILYYLATESGVLPKEAATQLVSTVINNVDLSMEEIIGIDWTHRRNEMKAILLSGMEKAILPYDVDVRSLYPDLDNLSYLPLR